MIPITSFVPADAVVDAVEALLDVAVTRHHDAVSGDTFTACGMCGGWEEHAPGCPVPVLDAWQQAGAPPPEPPPCSRCNGYGTVPTWQLRHPGAGKAHLDLAPCPRCQR